MTIRGNFVAEEGAIYSPDIDTGYNVVLRKSCCIGPGVQIWSNTVIDSEALISGDTKIHCNCYVAQRCKVGRGVFIGPGTQLLNDKYPVRTDPAAWEPVIVMDDVVIGGGVTVLPGVTIGEGALIGGGSVVTKDVPPGQVWAGNPAKQIGTRKQG